MDKFLPFKDALGEHIQSNAEALFTSMAGLDVKALQLPYHCEQYFIGSHSSRLFFSIETSAHILYHSIKKTGKRVEDVMFLDYGAGVGTLFLLAKKIGCKKVIYSDHLEDWKYSAQKIAKAVDISIDHYIVNDYRECLEQIQEWGYQLDILASRNVVEHIYNLEDFYKTVYEFQPQALIFSSTTANIKNPALVIRHKMIHSRWEKEYLPMRRKIIESKGFGFNEEELDKLAGNTRGLAMDDLDKAVAVYKNTGKMPDPSGFGTNTCRPENGLWAENLLSFEQHRKFINEENYHVSFRPGFWDTHYSKGWKNLLGKMLNRIKNWGDGIAFTVVPFIYIIAEPRKKNG